MNDVILNKTATIERCLNRIYEVYDQNPENLKNYTKQDSIALNIQRACEASIDLAMHLINEKGLGVPKSSRDGFKLLEEAGVIEHDLAKTLMNMVRFRNIAVNDYQALEIEILESILKKHLGDFRKFTQIVLKSENS